MSNCDVECLSAQALDGTLSLEARVGAAKSMVLFGEDRPELSQAAAQSLAGQLTDSLADHQLVKAIAEALTAYKVLLTKDALLSISSWLPEPSIGLHTRESLALLVSAATEHPNIQDEDILAILPNVAKCALKHNASPLRSICADLFARFAGNILFPPSIMAQLQVSLEEPSLLEISTKSLSCLFI